MIVSAELELELQSDFSQSSDIKNMQSNSPFCNFFSGYPIALELAKYIAYRSRYSQFTSAYPKLPYFHNRKISQSLYLSSHPSVLCNLWLIELLSSFSTFLHLFKPYKSIHLHENHKKHKKMEHSMLHQMDHLFNPSEKEKMQS